MAVKAYFDRNINSINGLFTIQEGKDAVIATPFKRIAVRSGQRGYTHTDWRRGKSPIPFGKYYLWLAPQNIGVKPGETGIGEFWPISNDLHNHRLIQGPGDSLRMDIGLHSENALPGSAGCIVIVAGFAALSAYLKTLKQPYIPLEVL